MMVNRHRISTALALCSAIIMLVGCGNEHSAQLQDVNLDTSNNSMLSSSPGVSGSIQSAADTIPDNPTQKLPNTISKAIPESSTMVSPDYAMTPDGKLKNVETGKTVTDAELVGTEGTPPDPLNKTEGTSFIPVKLSDVVSAVKAAKTSVHTASLKNNDYGAHWGTYNGTQAFFQKNGALFAQQAKGVIDVSRHNGTIDWSAAKAAGVEGAIIRIGFGSGNPIDQSAIRNINECKRLGIPFGVYLYSYSYDSSTAASEGASTVSLLRQAGVSPDDLSFPVYYDLENWTWTGHTPPTSPSVYNGIVNAWYAKLQAAGYNNLSVYSYTAYLNSALNSSNIHSKTRWVAQYGPSMGYTEFPTNDRGWQYTSSGEIDGISGNVDLSAFGNLTYVASVDATQSRVINIPDATYYINAMLKDSSSIDVVGGSTLSGAHIELYHYNKSKAQQFHFVKQTDGSYIITNTGSGKVLDVESGIAQKGSIVRQWNSNGSSAQRWFLRDSGEGYYIQSALGNWVLDIAHATASDGNQITLQPTNNTQAQKFLLSSAGTGVPTNVSTKVVSAIDTAMAPTIPAGSSAAVQMRLGLWEGIDEQRYRFVEVGNGVFEISNIASGKVMEVAGASIKDGGAVQQYSSNGTAAQHWTLIQYSGNRYTLLNCASGKALDIPGSKAVSSAPLQIYASNGTAAQQWVIARDASVREQLNNTAATHRGDVKDGIYAFGTANRSSMKIDVAAGSTRNGAVVRLWSGNGSGAQRWKVSHDSQGYITLTNVGSGKALDVAGGSAVLGTTVQQYDSNGTWAQKWIAVKQADGSVTLYSGITANRVLDVAGGLTSDGTSIQLYTPNGSKAQKWDPGN